jgi:hypothetical protein
MLHRRARIAVLAVFVASRILAAQSPAPARPGVTGAWTGSVVFKADGDSRQDPFHVVLKQDGGALTGTAVPSGTRAWVIVDGVPAGTTGILTYSLLYDP